MSLFHKLASKIPGLSKQESTQDKSYTVSGPNATVTMQLPHTHKLPDYQKLFKYYDRKLSIIAKLVYEKKGGSCVDIGANVGDTALLIRTATPMPVICIEGDSGYFTYLEQNTKNQKSISIVKCFVGKETETVKGSLVKVNGTGKIVADGSGAVNVLSLTDILEREKINPQEITLLKSDTDGFDFDILTGSKNFLTAVKPSLFFEYEINTAESQSKSLALIALLQEAGYRFLAYDNYGNFMSLIETDCVKRFRDLNTFILSSAANGGGIYYADIFASTDAEIINELYKQETEIFLKDAGTK